MRFKKLIVALVFLWLIPISVRAEEITIAAAANLQFTLEELKTVFENETGINIKTILGSSGKLTTQIENGAPFDIFMSADTNFPNKLYKDSFTLKEPKIYAYGALVLWTFKDMDLSEGLAVLADTKVKKVAIASPQVAPYGRQAVNAMKYAHLYPQIESKLVYGESISQVNQFIVTQSVDVGFTAKSIVLASNMKNKGRWSDVDPQSYKPIAQAVVLLKYSKHNSIIVEKFYNFLFSEEAQNIFRKYGYKLP